ncbi:MAG TPA: penicillin-binding transpeptidase domain-containing protein [Solirubrobacteraceae bacterium]|nr:penicillin-binding transpeptidase domain-containing protein [Solirubrobacteraceae bacterium]
MAQGGVLEARNRRRYERRRGYRRRRHRRRLLTHALPVAILAAAAFAAGVVLATEQGQAERQLVRRYVTDWEHRDYARMYGMLDRSSRARISETAFARQLSGATATATMRSLRLVRLGSLRGSTYTVRVRVSTRLWGRLVETLSVPLAGSGSTARVHFAGELLFPGLRPGERLHRHITLPPRAALLASDGTPLAQGPGRTSPIPDVAGQIVGTLGPIPSTEAAAYVARGYPATIQVGLDGLERIFQDRLAGQIGGTLLAGRRALATIPAVGAGPVQTTIDPAMERAAVQALGGQYAGIAVMNPHTGALEALAGIAFSDLQPPGSTMKIITSTAALQAGIVTLQSTFPVASGAVINGYTLHNANGESCGGTLLNAFAVSCNSVFAPLGARVGARALVATADRFGFNQPSSIAGAAESTIPAAGQIGDALAVGSSAIGQGLVQTTPLEMTDVAATIAMGGRRPIPTLLAHQPPRFVRVTTPRVAREVQQMMEAVVQFGTGTAAQIPGVVVAGKTGTAEIQTATNPNVSNPKNTDAWFVGYAPAGHPKIVGGALFPDQGAGGTAAAPAVRAVLAAALGR